MPFTFAHPAIILPLPFLNKRWFSLTGLIIGSMIPDFEYFIRMRIQSIYSHTIAGVFWFDLPLALFISFIFHNKVKNLLFQNSPYCLQSRLLIFTTFNWNNYFKQNWIVVLFSILIGTASHLLWDSFTHKSGYFVNHIAALQNSVYLFGIDIPILKMAQHLSTFAGSVIIFFALFKLPKNTISRNPVNKNYWFVTFLFFVLILILRFSAGIGIKEYGNIIVSIISVALLSLILTPIFFAKTPNKN
ncbi:DUF4184 family protein [Flavobacterium sp. YO64]|uniref:DUF4184 family protein n=1 Tax=Flavobacterium sp. YO64 TaxID=394559 RepID=UPI00100A75A7|nr:DUF4184 family protein [Flavobacterium sp. YO64]RXM43494.1 hypothetical protein BOW57_12675 [Flavobacterium sp. YO64]